MTGELTTEYKRARDATRKREDRQKKLQRRHEIKMEGVKAEDALELQRARGGSNLLQQKEVSSGSLAVAGERSRGAKERIGIASPTDLAKIPGFKAESAGAKIELTEKKRSLAEDQARRDAFNLAEEGVVKPKVPTAITQPFEGSKKVKPLIKGLRSPVTSATGGTRYFSGAKQVVKSLFAKDTEEKKKRWERLGKRSSLILDYLN